MRLVRRMLLGSPLLLGSRAAVAAPAAIEALFAPSARAWDRWAAHDAGSARAVDHATWTAILRALLRRAPDGSARVAYRTATPAIQAGLAGYIGALAAEPVSRLNRAEQFAYWANLYNALTLRVVLDRYPVKGIRDIGISPGLFGSGPWDARLVEIEGQAVTLNDIEHRILRPLWRDARVHYAVNCASVGCPDLLTEAFTGATLDRQLDAAARAYVNHPRGVSVEPDGLIVSSIYNWFAEDFGGRDKVTAHLLQYAASGLADTIRRGGAIRGYRYDWALNDAG
jgi:hypothetical protein